MIEVCRFYGIIIRMYMIDSENPPRHIHIKCGEYEAVIEFINLIIVMEFFPKSAADWPKDGLNCTRMN
jgi:hypothetical protein